MTHSGVAIVSGASRGLGAAIAIRLAADGWPVAVNYRHGRSAAEAVVAEIRDAGGVADAFGADVVDEAGVDDLYREVLGALGPVTAVIANATGPQPEVSLEEMTWRTHLDQLEFFVKSPTLLVQAALPSMRASGSGRVILIGSDMAERATPRASAYVAAKNAQIGLTKVWAKELGADGITVNIIQPGWIPVERHAGIDTEPYAAEVPLRRMGKPDDVAAMVAHLASDEGGFITGQRITINGGHVM
jgi:3-oxoacyl-[acyl-carrier protein] reductase